MKHLKPLFVSVFNEEFKYRESIRLLEQWILITNKERTDYRILLYWFLKNWLKLSPRFMQNSKHTT